MTQRINYSQSNQAGKILARSVALILDALAEARRTRKLLDFLTAGADWTAAAGELGVSQQEAQDLWAVFSNAANQIDSGAVTELSRLDQG